MKYKATIYYETGPYSQNFRTINEAAQWLDSENNNLENTTTIESYDDAGNKKDSFTYTERAR